VVVVVDMSLCHITSLGSATSDALVSW